MAGDGVLDWVAFFAQRRREGALPASPARSWLLPDLSHRDRRQKLGALRLCDASLAEVPGWWAVPPPFRPAAYQERLPQQRRPVC
jgi:hypothetical protein